MKKPLIYVDFWATWCAPCISSMPHTAGLQERFGNRVLFLFVSDEPEQKIRSFAQNHPYAFRYVSDPEGRNMKRLQIRAIPRALILDPDGQIIWQGIPGELTPEGLKKILATYANRNGDPHRLIAYRDSTEAAQMQWQTDTVSGTEVKYIVYKDDIPFACKALGNGSVCQGNLQNILAYVLDVEPTQIQTGENDFWQIEMPVTDSRKRKLLLRQFFGRFYHWNARQTQEDFYVLRENDTASWLNVRLYQYAEKPDQLLTLSDDQFLIIDNATPAQMALVLSEQTPLHFIYKGTVIQKFDWNIRYDTPEHLLEYLVSELDFSVRKTRLPVKIYRVSRRP